MQGLNVHTHRKHPPPATTNVSRTDKPCCLATDALQTVMCIQKGSTEAANATAKVPNTKVQHRQNKQYSLVNKAAVHGCYVVVVCLNICPSCICCSRLDFLLTHQLPTPETGQCSTGQTTGVPSQRVTSARSALGYTCARPASTQVPGQLSSNVCHVSSGRHMRQV